MHERIEIDSLDKAFADDIVTAYIGFDCTAKSLHAGSLMQIMILRRLQQAGHKPIVLMGGGTTRIGDPTGRDESRKMLSDAAIDENIAGIRTVFERLRVFRVALTHARVRTNTAPRRRV